MKINVLPDAKAVALAAAQFITAEAQVVTAARGRFAVAFSGGRTPRSMLEALTGDQKAWEVFQVDERVAPHGHPDRNLTQLEECLSARIHPMPVEEENLEEAARRYKMDGTLDLVHLGLGTDGHTASLVPGDPVLRVMDRDVAVTRVYQGRRRMTLTFPALNRARRILWVVTGEEKAGMLRRLMDGDTTIPAGRVSQERAFVLADCAAGLGL